MTCRRQLAVFLCTMMAVAMAHAATQATSPNRNRVVDALASVSGGRDTIMPIKPVGTLARLGRGAKSMALAPLELPATIYRTSRRSNVVEGVALGTVKGLGNGLSRLSAGTLDVLTSPIPGATLPPYTRRLGRDSSRYGKPIVIKNR